MNTKAMQDAIMAQATRLDEQDAKLQAQIEAHMHLVQRADNIVEGFKKELAGRDERLEQVSAAIDAARRDVAQIQGWIGADDVDGPFYPEFKALTARLEAVEKLVMARNSSAPTKRNMTDEDALRVLTGDLKDLSHKDAAEKAGLTYAQVYSCRLEFTFKHVHKALRDAATPDAPWVNSWAK